MNVDEEMKRDEYRWRDEKRWITMNRDEWRWMEMKKRWKRDEKEMIKRW